MTVCAPVDPDRTSIVRSTTSQMRNIKLEAISRY